MIHRIKFWYKRKKLKKRILEIEIARYFLNAISYYYKVPREKIVGIVKEKDGWYFIVQ